MHEDYATMAAALAATGRPIVVSICAWRFRDWMPGLAQLWRSGPDINDRWLSDRHSIVSIINKNGGDTSRYGTFSDETNPEGAFYEPPGVAGYAGPGHWNDPDMLEVGNGGMTTTEYRSHFSLWAIMAAPLIAGNDLTAMDEDTLAILLNREVIAVDQDPRGIQGRPISADTRHELWVKPLLGDRTFAVVLFNRDDAAADMTVTWSELGLGSSRARVRDLWQQRDLGSVALQYSATVPGHGVVMLNVAGE
jgi:alpha-galactosidase